MPNDRNDSAARLPTVRSKVTNGRGLFAQDGYGRGPWARRARDLIALHLSDLGGLDNTSEAERSIVRRIAVLKVELERLEASFSENAPTERTLDTYSRVSGQLRRLLETVALERRQNDKTLTLAEYLRSKEAEAEADVEEAHVVEADQ